MRRPIGVLALLLSFAALAAPPAAWPAPAEKPGPASKARAPRKASRGRRARAKPVQTQPAPVSVSTQAAPAPAPEPMRRGWTSAPTSLLLLDENGALVRELPLGSFTDELADGMQSRRELRGGATGRGQFAWHWEKKDLVQPGRVERVLSSQTKLSYLGTGGQILWESGAADAPPGLDPVLPSEDGETVLVFERAPSGWRMAAMTFSSMRLAELDAADRIEKARITRNGRFAMVLWGKVDMPLMGTFLELRTGARFEMAASQAPLAEIELTEDGLVVAEGKTLYKF